MSLDGAGKCLIIYLQLQSQWNKPYIILLRFQRKRTQFVHTMNLYSKDINTIQ